MNGYNVLIPSVSRSSAPEVTLPVMDALQALGHTPVLMDMASISAMYRQMRYERHGCYEIFGFYVRDLVKRNKVDFGFCAGLGVVLEDTEKREFHHLVEECEVPNVIYLHSREPNVVERLEAVGGLDWRHTYVAASTQSLAALLESRGVPRVTHLPLGTSWRIFYPAASPTANAPYEMQLGDPRLAAEYEVSFVGGHTPGRERLLSALARAGVSLAVFGEPAWRQSKELHRCWRNEVRYFQDLNTIYNASKINLDLPHDDCQFDDYLSSRVRDCLAGDNFLLTYPREGLGEAAEPGHEVALFEDADELVQAVKYYLADDLARHQIATRAYHRIKAEAGWGNRLGQLLPQLEMHLLTATAS